MANAADCEYWHADRTFLPAELRPHVLYPQEAHHAVRKCVAKEPVETWLGHAATLDPVLSRVWERYKAAMAPRAPAVEKETGGAKAWYDELVVLGGVGFPSVLSAARYWKAKTNAGSLLGNNWSSIAEEDGWSGFGEAFDTVMTPRGLAIETKDRTRGYEYGHEQMEQALRERDYAILHGERTPTKPTTRELQRLKVHMWREDRKDLWLEKKWVREPVLGMRRVAMRDGVERMVRGQMVTQVGDVVVERVYLVQTSECDSAVFVVHWEPVKR